MILGIGGHEYVLATKVKVDPGKKNQETLIYHMKGHVERCTTRTFFNTTPYDITMTP